VYVGRDSSDIVTR